MKNNRKKSFICLSIIPWFLWSCEIRPLLGLKLNNLLHISIGHEDREVPENEVDISIFYWFSSLPQMVGALIRSGKEFNSAASSEFEDSSHFLFSGHIWPILVRLPLLVLHQLRYHHDN